MYTIKTLNAISPVGLAKLNNKQFDVAVDTDAPDGILVRSADMLNTTFNDNLLAIARAGAGVNNIPLDRCSEQGIVVFNTPGANANAVAELVIGMLIAGSRNVAVAAQWCQGLTGDPAMAKTVEKGKKQFVGNEIKGKTLGVIGLGAIGSRVANCAIELGMEVYGYDPYISIDAAWNLSSQVRHCVNLNDMLPLCDYITIHVPYLPTTKDTINVQTLALCKDGVKILNYARGELVNTEALLEAMETGKVSGYMTDFPSEAILGKPGIVCTPHLGASTPEAEDNCAVMAAKELSDYLKNGNIIHSVNMPEVNQPRAGGKRICIIHKNEPGMISQITALTTEAGLNIENMVNKSKKNMAYTMLDATGAVDKKLAEKLAAIREGGATRISINPQTFSDEVLAGIGRKHSAQDILDCYAEARKAGHDDINMDLIAGLPGDTVESFERSLRQAIALDPENITVHTLTLKRASRIVIEDQKENDYADVAAMLEKCRLLAEAGYRPYYLYRQKNTLQNLENVGWCKPGHEGYYNIYIMEEVQTILSAGAGGSTKLVADGGKRMQRIFNFKYPNEYIQRFAEVLERKKGVADFYDHDLGTQTSG